MNFILKSLFITSFFFFISVNAHAQGVADQLAVATDTQNVIVSGTSTEMLEQTIAIVPDKSNRIYSATEIGDYRNYCEYGDASFFLPDSNRFLISIDKTKATTSNMILGCFPVSYNSNGIFYNLIKMDLLPSIIDCPRIDLTEAFPVGTPTPIYEFMNLTPQSYYHRSAAVLYLPRMNLAFSKDKSCYYSYAAQNPAYGEDKKEYMAYFFLGTSQLKDFVKGHKYVERYASRFVPGASWEGVTIEEATKSYYNLPNMQLSSYQTSDKYNTETDLNMNKGKYLATSTREVTGKQELDNVIFFPGILGSQLQNSYTNQIIWPSVTKDIQSNMQVVNPSSIHAYSLSYPFPSNVYTYNDIKSKEDGGVLRNYFLSTNGGSKVNTVDIYDSFLTELDKLKANNEMRPPAAIPYDFRMFTDDIYCSSNLAGVDKVSYDTQSYGAFNAWPFDCRKGYIYGEMKRLALTSKTGKITLVGHSYGGLVMKEILKQLEESNDSLLSKIDKVILVAVPQGGVPESVASMLHGKEIGIFSKPLNASTVRQMSITFPSAYELLPSDKLLDKIKVESSTPLIKFSNKSLNGINSTTSPNAKQYTKYGDSIDNYAELYDYVINKEGRPSPVAEDLNNAQVGYSNLIYYAKARRESLDNYVPTSTIEVHQIAGWGIPTDIGYSYDYIDNGCLKYTAIATTSPLIPLTCSKYGMNKQINVIHSTDGDDTVPTASALWISTTTNSNVHNWWVDLYGYNKERDKTKEPFSKTHKNILAVSELIQVVVKNLRGLSGTEKYIYNNKPKFVTSYETVRLHSPVNLSITDKSGNMTGYSSVSGDIVNNITNVYYEEIGDTKIITAPTDLDYKINLEGYTDGVYTLNIDKYDIDNKVIASTTYYAIPTASSSVSSIVHTSNGNSSLIMDLNGNGNIDAIISATSSTYTASSTRTDTVSINQYTQNLLNSLPEPDLMQVENPPLPPKPKGTTTPPKLPPRSLPPRPLPSVINKLIKK